MTDSETVIPSDAVWRYKVLAWNDTSDLSTADSSGWAQAAMPFGDSGPENGLWPNDTIIWLHYLLPPTNRRNITVNVTVEDNGGLWVNGAFVAAQHPSGSGTAAGSDSWLIPNEVLTGNGDLFAVRGRDEHPPAGDTYLYVNAVSVPTIGMPPCRLFPRDDHLGVGGARRHYPPPTSQQRSGRRFGYH